MGIYLNPGREAYEEAVYSEIYVDKTEMIQFLNSVVKTKQKYVSVSRPRRFGKSMAADMICAYYDRESDSRELFSKRKIAACEPVKTAVKVIAWDEYLGGFDVIRIVMTDFIKAKRTVTKSLEILTSRILDELSELYPEVQYDASDLFLVWIVFTEALEFLL